MLPDCSLIAACNPTLGNPIHIPGVQFRGFHSSGFSALHYAAQHGHKHVLAFLIKWSPELVAVRAPVLCLCCACAVNVL